MSNFLLSTIQKMKYLVCEKPYKLLTCNKPIPEPAAGESLLKIQLAGVCGTDIHAYEGTQPFFDYPRILGHELCAEYLSGSKQGVVAGDRVTIIPYFHCGQCIACKQGRTNCCVNIKVFGVHIDGGFSEYIIVKDEYIVAGKELSLEELVVVEPLAIAAHAIGRAQVSDQDTVLIMGVGPIGAGLIHFAKVAGAQKIIVMDTNKNRLQYAKDILQVDDTINPTEEDVMVSLNTMTNGDMPTVVLDATGNHKVLEGAFSYMAHGGRYVLVGIQKSHLSFSHPEFHKREATLMSSRNATLKDFNFVIDCLQKGKINLQKYITHYLPFSTIESDFESLRNANTDVLKAVIDFAK